MTTLTTLYSFDGTKYQTTDGTGPSGNLLMDATGNLFGTTGAGGTGYGTVFELAWNGSGYASAPTTLLTFNYTNGSGVNPYLTMDAAGNLFGVTQYGGPASNGEVFELVKTSTGYTQTILYSFTSSSGANPAGSGLVLDAAGNLFGVTTSGGANGKGTVFEIAKTESGYASTPTVLASFDTYSAGGAIYNSALIIDAAGNLFGTTELGGAYGKGTVYEIAKTANGYASTPIILASLDGSNGSYPLANLITDADGNLFGTTSSGGANNDGTVFEIAKTATGYANALITLVSFNGTNGYWPNGRLLIDTVGNLYGSVSSGPGSSNSGAVFEIVKTETGYASTPTALAAFNGSNGSSPQGGLIMDAAGHIFGATGGGGLIVGLMVAGRYSSSTCLSRCRSPSPARPRRGRLSPPIPIKPWPSTSGRK